jgi:hypothetical protein
MCPANHINSRSLLRSSSTREPSDPPHRVVFVFIIYAIENNKQSIYTYNKIKKKFFKRCKKIFAKYGRYLKMLNNLYATQLT